MMKKVSIFIEHHEDDRDFVFMQNWLEKWKDHVRIADYASGGWEHTWDLEAPDEAIAELPNAWRCASDWAGDEA